MEAAGVARGIAIPSTKNHSEFRCRGRMYLQCRACHHPCSLNGSTIFLSSKRALRDGFRAMHPFWPGLLHGRPRHWHAP